MPEKGAKFYGYAKVALAGRATSDAKLVALPSGTPKATFSLAVNHRNDNGAEFFNVVAFGEQAQLEAELVKKGEVVKVNGRLTQRSFDNKEGSRKHLLQIVASDISRFESKAGKLESATVSARKAPQFGRPARKAIFG